MAVLGDRVVRNISSAFTEVLYKCSSLSYLTFPKILGGGIVADLLYIMDGKTGL